MSRFPEDLNDNGAKNLVEGFQAITDIYNKLKARVDALPKEIKDDLLGGAGEAYDTLKELGDLIDENRETIETLKTIAATHVRFDVEQSLTTEQQATARKNISAASVAALSSETSARTTADTTLQSNIDTEASTRESADAALQSKIEAETSDRTSADAVLQGAINSEASDRESADTALQGKIEAESTARSDADTSLGERIDALIKALAAVATSGEYKDLIGVPTKVSQFENDSAYLTESDAVIANLKTTTESNTTNISALQDSTVKYSDPQSLTDAQKRQARNNIDAASTASIPTKTSELENDSGYITSSDVPDAVTVDSALSETSTNPVQNKVIAAALAGIEGGDKVTAETIKTALGYTPADADKYLKLTGGTLTGDLNLQSHDSSIKFSKKTGTSGVGVIGHNSNNGGLSLRGGNNANTCSCINLYGHDYTTLGRAEFELQSTGSDGKNHVLKSDNYALNWDNKHIALSVNGIEADSSGNIALSVPTVTDTYDAQSSAAMSGKAVAQAIAAALTITETANEAGGTTVIIGG